MTISKNDKLDLLYKCIDSINEVINNVEYNDILQKAKDELNVIIQDSQ